MLSKRGPVHVKSVREIKIMPANAKTFQILLTALYEGRILLQKKAELGTDTGLPVKNGGQALGVLGSLMEEYDLR